jgi:hypothetical protein
MKDDNRLNAQEMLGESAQRIRMAKEALRKGSLLAQQDG